MSCYLVHHLLAITDDAPDRAAIIEGERTYSYGELSSAVDALAVRLLRAGVVRGDRVAILLPKSFNECVAIFAASRADAVFVPINPSLRLQQVIHILRDCGARALITSSEWAERLAKEGMQALSPTLSVLMPSDAVVSKNLPPLAASIGEDLAAILYTSGSTGAPKGVMLSHRNLLAGTRIVRTYLDIRPDDRILSVLPFSFDYGLNQLLTVTEQGAMLVLLTFQLGDEIVRALSHHRITGLAGVPTVWAFLTRGAPKLARTELPHLRYITNSGGAVPSTTVQRLRELLPTTRVFLMYGLTEAFRSTYLPPEELDRRPTSIGKAIPECEVFLVGSDGNRPLPGEPGILVHRGPTVSLGYWNRPEDTARVLRRHPFRSAHEGGEIVCYSGDLATQDEDGFFYFVGRDDAMIKSAGFRISPTEVEEILMASGQFRHVAVIGLPDAWVGQRLHAVGVAATSSFDQAVVLKEASQKLPQYMVPKQIELVDALPMTPNGKIDYKQLAADRR